MIYDEETDHWYINEYHLEHCKKCFQANARLQKRLPLSREEIEAQAARWKALQK